MIKNYFKIAWRNVIQNKFYSAINLVGLTVGLTVGILILLWVQNELSYNSFAGREQHIYKVNSNVEMSGGTQVWYTTPGPVAAFAKSDIPEVNRAVRIAERWDYSVFSDQEKVFEADKMAYCDPELFTLFKLHFLEGSATKPFIDNQSIVLTKSLAHKYFGDTSALGKTIQADHEDSYTVTGVIEDIPENSSISYDLFFPLSIMAAWYNGKGYWKSLDSDWGNFNYTTYLELKPNASVSNVRDMLAGINLRNDPNAPSNKVERAYELQAITDMNLHRPDGSPSGIQTVKIFTLVALLILLIGSINYINLATARSMTRAKEVSMRKIIGAQRQQLIFQFIIESALFILVAVLLSFSLIFLVLPSFNNLMDTHLHLNLLDQTIWRTTFAVAIFIILASSLYPAFLLSSFKPLESLKGKLGFGIGHTTFRHVLVTVQFVFSIGLIVGTLIIGRQLHFLNTNDPGFQRAQVITFDARENMLDHMASIKSELSRVSGIKGVAVGNGKIYNIGYTTGDTDWEGKDPNNTSFVVREFAQDEHFIPLMGMQLALGRNFTGSKTDSAHYILNETAVRAIGLKNPVGKRFTLHEVEGTIIGVIKDFNMASMKYAIEPVVIRYNPAASTLYIKTEGKDATSAIQAAKRIWDRYNTGFPFHYRFLDADYASLYQREQRTARLFSLFCAIAVLVSCLGLFGLATYTAKIRRKEIGIRKVIGASVTEIILMLSTGFLRWILLAFVIACPIAYYAMDKWLQDFNYRISISWPVFAMTGLLAMIIAILTISIQAVKAATANPVESLRDE